MAINPTLFSRQNDRFGQRITDDENALPITDPMYATNYVNNQFNRGREAMMDPQWSAYFESLPQGAKIDTGSMTGIPMAQPGLDYQTYQASNRSPMPMSVQALNDAVPAPIVKGKGVSGPQPLSEKPLPPLQQPTPTPNGPTSQMRGQLQAVPRPWTPNLPARNLLPPGSLMGLQQAANGSGGF